MILSGKNLFNCLHHLLSRSEKHRRRFQCIWKNEEIMTLTTFSQKSFQRWPLFKMKMLRRQTASWFTATWLMTSSLQEENYVFCSNFQMNTVFHCFVTMNVQLKMWCNFFQHFPLFKKEILAKFQEFWNRICLKM